jgi:two-component system, cell cycle sensor histidine kinase and response regulator CckA
VAGSSPFPGYRHLVEKARELLALHDAEGRFTFASPSAEALVGYRPDELVGRSPLEFVAPADRARVQESLRKALAGESVPMLTARFVRRDGEVRWIEVHSEPIAPGEEGGDLHRLLTTSRDVTGRMELLAGVARGELKLRTILSSLEDLVFVFDRDGVFREYYQPRLHPHLYAPPAAFLGRHYRDLLPLEVVEELDRVLPEAAGRDDASEFDYVLEVGGAPRTYSAKVTSLRGGTGAETRHEGFVAVVRDVTERRREGEERLALVRSGERAERLEGLASLARGTAHQFNNLLTTILGNLSLLEKDDPTGATAPELEAAIVAIREAALVTRRLLTFAGEGMGPRERLDPAALVEGVAAALRPLLPGQVTLGVAAEPGVPAVEVDRDFLEGALRSLIRNALEALGEKGGRLDLSVGSSERSERELSGSRVPPPPGVGRFVVIALSDDGEGMPPEVLERALDPYFSTRFLGRGLGLPEVAGVARAHGGALFLASAPGEGTTVELLLPAVAPDSAPTSADAA